MSKKNFTFSLDPRVVEVLKSKANPRLTVTDMVDMALKNLIIQEGDDEPNGLPKLLGEYFSGTTDVCFDNLYNAEHARSKKTSKS